MSAKQPQSFLEELNSYSEVKHVIGIVSGKGGVGKSMATASLANLLASKGLYVPNIGKIPAENLFFSQQIFVSQNRMPEPYRICSGYLDGCERVSKGKAISGCASGFYHQRIAE